MRLRLTLVLALVLVFAFSVALGERVGGRRAVETAQAWLATFPSAQGSRMSPEMEDVLAYPDEQGEALFYLVKLRPAGFLVLSPDDLIEPVIAFSARGAFEADPRNPLYDFLCKDLFERRAWVDAQQSYSRLRGERFVPSGLQRLARDKWEALSGYGPQAAIPSVDDPRVSPLVGSRWNQSTDGGGYCYNYYTPNHYVCGCVATAMAQLIRFHSFPTAGIGVHSYSYTVDGSSQSGNTRGGDDAGGAYVWASMPLDPPTSTPEAERQMIGRLTWDCGISVNMSYASGGSGTDTLQSATALKSLFTYSNAIKGYRSGGELVGNGYNEMANPNLDAGLPVLLGITGSAGGHAIVCDGYGYNAGTLYHHLNMGWSGSDDAWYDLPNIGTWAGFTTVYKCVYNVFTSGTGQILSGRVVDTDGNPVSGVTVSAGGYTDTTDSRGIYALVHIPAGTYTVTAAKTGYVFPDQAGKVVGTSVDNGAVGNLWGVNFQQAPTVPTIGLSTTALANSSAQGVSAPSQSFEVWNAGLGTVSYTVTDDAAWLSCTPTTGTSTGEHDTITVNYATVSLPCGTYTAVITVTDPGATPTSKQIAVTLTVDYPALLSEGFENGGAIPAGWTQENVTGTTNWTFATGGYSSHPAAAHGGTYNARLYFNSSSGIETRLVTPSLDLSGASSATLSFWHAQAKWVSDQDELRIYYRNTAGGAWTLIPDAVYTADTPNWTQRTVTLPGLTGTYWIAFQGKAKYGYGVCVDDVTVRAATGSAAVPFDFNRDGRSDILWRNNTLGTLSDWFMGQAGLLGSGFLGGIGDLQWQVAATGDFNKDGYTDILWRHAGSGALSIWFVNASGFAGDLSLGSVALSWIIQGANDVNADGISDILWRNTADGFLSVWLMTPTGVSGSTFAGGISDLSWVVLGSGDFNGDGKADFFWRHHDTGTLSIWYQTEAGFAGDASPGTIPTTWKIVGLDDVDGDGITDIFWRNASGDLSVWLLNASAGIKGTVSLGSVADTQWKVAGTGDFNGDGKADLFWRNAGSGAMDVWFLDGSGVVSTVSPGAVDPVWVTLNHVNFPGKAEAE